MANEIDINIGSFDLNITNDITISDIQIKVAKALKKYELAKYSGSIIPIAKRSDITIPVRGMVMGSNYDDLRTNLDALKAAIEDITDEINFTIDDDRYIAAQINNFSMSWLALRTLAQFSFELIASDPFWYGLTLQEDDRTPTSGVAYTITNSGNAPTRVKVTITANTDISDDIQLENLTNGEIFQYRGDLDNTKELVVNNRIGQRDLEVTNDGSDDIANHEGDFITLEPGDNSIEYTGADADVKLEFRYAWY